MRLTKLWPMPLLGAVLALATSGCKTLSGSQQTAYIGELARETAFLGAYLDLADHPEHRPAYETACGVIQIALRDQTLDYAKLTKALQKLAEQAKISRLTGQRGIIVVATALTLYDATANTLIDPAKTPELVRVLGQSIVQGVQTALEATKP